MFDDDWIAMTFSLETIDAEDIARVVSDAASDVRLSGLLKYLDRSGDFPKVWARNVVEDSYLLIRVDIVPREVPYASYLFYSDGELREVRVANFLSSDVCFAENPSLEKIDRAKSLLTQAFAVFGRSGRGPITEFGFSEKLVPRFVEGF